ncbi:NADH-quinone oxidoreductase subunit N [Stackebrandtia nassauensis]|uniref:NADH-quinone oxidoreductase subunit N n=1 Tax=Stackebrandtia nassauensis (strain DSM 44728 / CIP 108903 / NRRL B-16338 / NBRC 102104 / LLR-40K-21) TaxID=446470 RepID=D3Q943_STANL|nr:NADH-quinone oxidoreductase subunit N [Stackebrandtia nassauensis]ADD40652.1 NADH/Ubiquinone/plastoquinone (complex I) [Stackebrandtia nassauensis DSM 44728]
MNTQAIDHVALLPGYLAAATAVLALLTDLVFARRAAVLAVTGLGVLATAVGAVWVASLGERQTFCTDDGCSYVTSRPGALVVVVLCALTLAVLGLSAPTLRDTDGPPVGEYTFLLACSLTGGVLLAYARDLITLVVALETLTLPLYVLVAMRRKEERSAEASVNFLLVSVAASALTLFGAALLYAVTGTVQLTALASALDGDTIPLTAAAVALVVTGMAFKVAAVPLHGWAPGTYDGAPLPVAAYLSTASKLGGVVALVWVLTIGLKPVLPIAGTVLAVLAVATMTVGNLAALRQTRAVRLLAWSSIAQAGYLLAPLGALAAATGPATVRAAATAVIGFAVFYAVMELAAFAALIGLRGRHPDGGELTDYTGAARRSPLTGAVLILALTALAGLPPGLAGLFAKITVISAVAGAAPWLAVVIAVNAVIGLVYYLRFSVLLLRPGSVGAAPAPWPVAATVAISAVVALVVGFAPQLILGLA